MTSLPPSASQSPRRRDLLLLAAILLLATLLRVGWPRLTEYKFSEARLHALALEITREGNLPLVGVPSSAGFDHSPLSVYLYVPAFLLTADPLPATIYGGLAGVAAVALCWWLARRWPGGGPLAAFVAALLLAVSPWAVAFSRKIWQVTFVPLLSLAFVALAVSSLILGRRWNLAWALLVLSVLIQVHPSAISMGLALLLWLVVFWRRVRLVPLLAGLALGLLAALPFLAHQLRSGWQVLSALGALPASVWDLGAVQLAWEAITGRGIHALAGGAYPLLEVVPRLGWAFNLVGWLTVVSAVWLAWGLFRYWRSKDGRERAAAQVDLVLLTWLAIPIVFNLRHNLDLHLHFFALTIPAAAIVLGRAAQGIVQRMGRTKTAIKAGVLALVGLLAAGQVAALVLMAQFVATHDTPGGFERPLGRYLDLTSAAVAAAERMGATEVLVVGPGDSPVVDEIPAIFDALLRDRIPSRLVDGGTTALFPAHSAVALVAPEAGEASVWYRPWQEGALADGFWLAALDGSWPEASLAAVAGPRLFQNGVELQAYHLDSSEMPDDRVRVALLWQVLWQSPDDTHFFVHLLDEAQQQLGSQDDDAYPSAQRVKGDRILSEFDINLGNSSDTGPYWIRAGQYLFPQITNLPIIDEAGNPVADSVLMGPVDGER